MTLYLWNIYIGTAQKRRSERIGEGREEVEQQKVAYFFVRRNKILSGVCSGGQIGSFFLRNIIVDLVEPIFCGRSDKFLKRYFWISYIWTNSRNYGHRIISLNINKHIAAWCNTGEAKFWIKDGNKIGQPRRIGIKVLSRILIEIYKIGERESSSIENKEH